MYQKVKNGKEAMNKVLRDLKAKSKIQMKHFKGKMTGVCLHPSFQVLGFQLLGFRRFKVLLEVANPQATWCSYGQRLKSMHVSFINMLRGQNERSKVR